MNISMKNRRRFTRPPRQLSRRNVRLDNVALVPASLLPYKEQWQKIANNLPRGGVLIVLPATRERGREVYEMVARSFGSLGKHVWTVGIDAFLPDPR